MPDITELPEWAVKEAKDIVGGWGYEESYWWQPIAKALARARVEGARERQKKLLQAYKINPKMVIALMEATKD